MEPIDIFITTYLREKFAKECLQYLFQRTKTPYRVTILDNGGNEWAAESGFVHHYVPLWKAFGNTGIHFAWNVAVSLAEGKYFITSDPDLLVPDLLGVDLSPFWGKSEGEATIEAMHAALGMADDWLGRMMIFMDERPDYGAISMMPHIFVGAAGIDPKDPEDVKERNMCGAVMRIMRTDAVKEVGGWDMRIEAGRNHEERTICSRLQNAGYKTGITSRIRAFHNFGENWGYPEEFTPEMQKHNPALKEYVKSFDNREAYDPKTWLPKI
jgi:GT2 family glycosyltransferase